MSYLTRVGLILAISAGIPTTPAAAQDTPEGSIVIFTSRIDDFFHPSSPFFAGFDIELSGLANVSSVTVDIDHGGSSDFFTLVQDAPGVWSRESFFASLNDLKTQLDGAWTVTVTGSTSSTSTFTLDTNSLVDGDYLPTPTNATPANGTIGIPPDVVFSWNAPPGVSLSTGLAVDVEDENGINLQEAISLDGNILPSAVSWDPPADLLPGVNDFSVTYFEFADPALLSAISVDSGTINWLNPLGNPNLWPNGKALLTLEATTFVNFEVEVVPEPASAALLVALITVFHRRPKRA